LKGLCTEDIERALQQRIFQKALQQTNISESSAAEDISEGTATEDIERALQQRIFHRALQQRI
jgi:hypothetical protein